MAPSTTVSKLMEFAWDGTNWNFFLDGVLVAQISTHVPTASTVSGPILEADNKNTNNAIAWTMNYMTFTMK